MRIIGIDPGISGAIDVRTILDYDAASGLFTWLVSPSRKVRAGDIAGSVDGNRQVVIRYLGMSYLAHRLAWLYMTGAWPRGEVDHRNGNGADNRWSNLRDVTHAVNIQNQRRAKRNNKVGVLGVIARGNRFGALIRVDGKPQWLGTFDTADAAYAAYQQAKRRMHAGCTI